MLPEDSTQKERAVDFAGLKDEELVFYAKQDNALAIELLVNRYKAFVMMRSKTYFLCGADRDDVIQEGMIGLFKAIRSFKAERGVSFKTFAELCITRHIISAVKTSTRQKHAPLNTYVSLDRGEGSANLERDAFKSGNDPEQIMIEKENMVGIEGQIDKALSRFEARVLMHYLNGMSYGKIAVCMGKDPKSIDNALQRIKRKLERFLLS
ncbi:MAG: RNA polymerase sporulation sigma factor SigH [Clostridia bacterium]|nr:RNA polymerase sporulation sigma factor SigH [Clostridia bacterium]